MTTVVIVLAVLAGWTALAALVGTVIGRSVRLADEQSHTDTEENLS